MKRTPKDWVLFSTLVLLFGSAFMFVDLSVATVPPMTLVASRLMLGAVFVYGWMRFQGDTLPPFFVRNGTTRRVSSHWLYFTALAIVGNILPFFLISWGQLTIDSGLAGILMAIMPLATMMLAHFFVPNEHLTTLKIVGFALGFIGVLILIGPGNLTALSTAPDDLFAQLAVLGGALCYATNSIIARHAPRLPAAVSSTGILMIGSSISLTLALVTEQPWTATPDTIAVLSVIILGLFTTALATVVYMELVQTAGPSFFALTNYLVPVVAVFFGVIFLGETLEWRAIAALGLVLLGIFISQPHPMRSLFAQIFSSPSR